MEDLSGLFKGGPVNALVPTSQEATGSYSFTNERAQTGPGGDPASQPGPEPSPPPAVDAIARPEARTVTHGDDSGARGGPPVLRLGAWNDMGGGPAPERR